MRFDIGVTVKIRDAYAARHEPEAERVLATFYWAFLVTVFSLVVAGAVGLGVWEYLRPLTADGSGSTVSAGAHKALTKSDIQNVLEGLDARAQSFEARRTAPILVRDPS